MSDVHQLAFVNPNSSGHAFNFGLHAGVARNHAAIVSPETYRALCNALAAFRDNPFLAPLHIEARFQCPALADTPLWARGPETFIVNRRSIILRLRHRDHRPADIDFDVLGFFIYPNPTFDYDPSPPSGLLACTEAACRRSGAPSAPMPDCYHPAPPDTCASTPRDAC